MDLKLNEKLRPIWEFINSNFGMLVLGTIITTILGSWLNHKFQKDSWEREANFQILQQELNDGNNFIENLSDQINRRFFNLQRVLWVLESSSNKERILEIWDEYYQSVIEWNQKLDANRHHLEIFGGKQLANQFMSPGDSEAQANPKSIHGYFRLAHIRILEARSLKFKNSSKYQNKIREVRNYLEMVNKKIDRFIYDLTKMHQAKVKQIKERKF